MNAMKRISPKRLLGVAVAAAALISPAIASAQEYPTYATAGADQQIQGTISSINGTWNITVADSDGYSDSVELHQGTIINPTGLTLQPGMTVTIDGYPDGSNFDAVEIDAPYQYAGPAPTAAYYGPGSWYPGYAYGWGPSFSLIFDFSSSRYEQRSFNVNGQVRRPMAPPAGWQDRPHGFVGGSGNPRAAYAPQTRTYAPPQQSRQFVAPPPQQSRQFAAPPQQQPARQFAAPPQQQPVRQFAAPPQQQPARQFAAPPHQQTRQFAAPPQQARQAATPQQRAAAAPASRTTADPRMQGGAAGHRW